MIAKRIKTIMNNLAFKFLLFLILIFLTLHAVKGLMMECGQGFFRCFHLHGSICPLLISFLFFSVSAVSSHICSSFYSCVISNFSPHSLQYFASKEFSAPQFSHFFVVLHSSLLSFGIKIVTLLIV